MNNPDERCKAVEKKNKEKPIGEKMTGVLCFLMFIMIVVTAVRVYNRLTIVVDTNRSSQIGEKEGIDLAKDNTLENKSSKIVEIPDPVLKKRFRML